MLKAEIINHLYSSSRQVSALQQHPHTLMLCDEPATMELKVKTVKYFKVGTVDVLYGLCRLTGIPV